MADRLKKTVYIGGIPDNADEAYLVSAFSTFGDILEVNIPRDFENKAKHRNFGFVVYSTIDEAEDCIDNMHLNELGGKIINVNFARPLKTAQAGGTRPVWEDEEWIKKYSQPLGGGGTVGQEGHEDARIGEEREAEDGR